MTACNKHHLDDRVVVLLQQHKLSDTDITELEAINHTLTKILLQADRQC